MIQLTFLGTSSGTPSKRRNVSALALQGSRRHWYLIDCGEATQHQLLWSNLSLRALHTIFITHVHGDHCYGLPGLLASAALQGRTEPLQLMVPADLKTWLQATLELTQMYLSYELQFQLIEELNEPIMLPDFKVQPIKLSHRVASFAFKFTELPKPTKLLLNQEKLQADGIAPSGHWGQLQRGKDITLADGKVLLAKDYLIQPNVPIPQAVIIGGDNDKPELLAPYLEQVQVVVHEATFTQTIADKVGTRPQHSSAKQVAQFAEQYQVPNVILTHFSTRFGEDMTPIEDEVRAFYHGQWFLARDFDQFQLTESGTLVRVSQEADED